MAVAPVPRPRLSCGPGCGARELYNATQNGIMIVDARSKHEYEAAHAYSAQHVDAASWELPDDMRGALVYGCGEHARHPIDAIVARLRARMPALKHVQVCEAPFSEFQRMYPWAVTRDAAGDATHADSEVMLEGTFPQHIADQVWLGSAFHAERPQVLAALRIANVVCVMDDPGGASATERVCVRTWKWVDDPSFLIIDDLPDVADYIEAARTKGDVLIHCYHGASRSAAAAAAWLIRYKRMSVDDAHAHLRAARSIVRINSGFLDQLREFNVDEKSRDASE